MLRCAEPDTLDSKNYSIIKDCREARESRGKIGHQPVLGLAAHEGHFLFQIQSDEKDSSLEKSDQRDLVELIGIEPTTSGLQSPRSPS